PVLFLIQNNGYAISVPQTAQTHSSIKDIAEGFGIGMPSYRIEGTWYEPLYALVPGVIEKMRAGGGPVLIEADVIRMDSHSSSDDQMKYRTEAEMKELRKRDPLAQTERYLLGNGIYAEENVAQIGT